MDAKKIILWCCILLTRTYKPTSLDVKNTNHCEPHQKGNHLPSLCLLHHTLCTPLPPPHVLHSAINEKPVIPLWLNGNHGTLYSWKNSTTHTHTSHFTFQSITLQALLMLQTEHLYHCIHYLTKHMIMKAWVKIRDSILHHHKWISNMGLTCLLYTPWNISHTSLCTFLWNIWHITWRMFSKTSCFHHQHHLLMAICTCCRY
jgi:hypothetical protein